MHVPDQPAPVTPCHSELEVVLIVGVEAFDLELEGGYSNVTKRIVLAETASQQATLWFEVALPLKLVERGVVGDDVRAHIELVDLHGCWTAQLLSSLCSSLDSLFILHRVFLPLERCSFEPLHMLLIAHSVVE